MGDELSGLPVTEALLLLSERGIVPRVLRTMPPNPDFHAAGRSLRVVSFRGDELIAAYFQDQEPGDQKTICK